jgi:glycosyltransferase involved in cell wall biosynthesis
MLKNMKESYLAFLQLPFFILSEVFHAARIFQKKKFDLVHAHWSVPQGFTALFLKKLFTVPCVTSLHGSDVYGLNYPLLRGLNRKVILSSDACTANSRATAETARRIAGKENIRVIPMGVDIDFFSNSSGREMGEDRNRSKEKIVLYAGRLIEWKGVDSLIKAFPAVLEKQPNTRLLVVGSGPRRADLVSLSERLHLRGKVQFEDAVSQDKLASYYSMADVFVLPSVMTDEGETEGLGVVLLEAMASGVPVIGSAIGGIPDIIEDGKTGLLAQQKNPVDLAEKINRVLANQDLRRCLSKRGQDSVRERFSWPSIAKRYLEVFKAVSENKVMLADENASSS